jgi:hypothetical protein
MTTLESVSQAAGFSLRLEFGRLGRCLARGRDSSVDVAISLILGLEG